MAKATDAALIKKCDTIHRKYLNYELVAKLSYPAFTTVFGIHFMLVL